MIHQTKLIDILNPNKFKNCGLKSWAAPTKRFYLYLFFGTPCTTFETFGRSRNHDKCSKNSIRPPLAGSSNFWSQWMFADVDGWLWKAFPSVEFSLNMSNRPYFCPFWNLTSRSMGGHSSVNPFPSRHKLINKDRFSKLDAECFLNCGKR